VAVRTSNAQTVHIKQPRFKAAWWLASSGQAIKLSLKPPISHGN